jgi:quinol monooxygenase YgiN
MAVAVIGHFRLLPERVEEARPLMTNVVEATLAEQGCLAYSYAEDVREPGLIRVSEMWESREHLAAHFETAHMRNWVEERKGLGLFDRQIALYELGESETL